MRFAGACALTSATGIHRITQRDLRDWRQTVARMSFLLVLAAGPLCFGATEPSSFLVLEAGVLAVLLLWTALSWSSLTIELDRSALPLLLFALLAMVLVLRGGTAYRYASEEEFVKAAAYFLFFFLARQFFTTHEARKPFAIFATMLGGLLAMLGIIQRLQGNGRIYWIRATSTESFFGTYANKNHYAGLMELLVPFALYGAAAERSATGKRAVFAFAASVMIASVFLSGSRSGSLVTLFEIVAFTGVVLARSGAQRQNNRRRLLLIVSFALAFVVWIAGEAVLSQAKLVRNPKSDASLVNRSQIARDSWQLVKQKPLLGWGLGTFSTVYPQAESWYTDLEINAAHDDYLQLLVETGIVGFVLIVFFLAAVFYAGLQRIFRTGSSSVSAALLGCSGLLLHSFTDFNLHVPANAAMFFALCGMICAADRVSASKLPGWGGEYRD